MCRVLGAGTYRPLLVEWPPNSLADEPPVLDTSCVWGVRRRRFCLMHSAKPTLRRLSPSVWWNGFCGTDGEGLVSVGLVARVLRNRRWGSAERRFGGMRVIGPTVSWVGGGVLGWGAGLGEWIDLES